MTWFNKNEGISVLIAEDHPLYRQGLAELIQTYEGILSVDQVSDGLEALNLIQAKDYHLLLLDLRMKGMDGEQTVRELSKLSCLRPKIIIISYYDDQDTIRKMAALGVDGYLVKNAAVDEIFIAMTNVLNGESYFPFGYKVDSSQNQESLLTDREIKIIKYICKQFTNRAIAIELNISEYTVMRHKQNIREKTGVTTLAGFVSFALKNNLVDIDHM